MTASSAAADRDKFVSEVQRLVNAVGQANVMLRLFGSLAFQLRCPRFGYLRQSFHDIDFGGYGKHARAVSDMMLALGYVEDREVFVVSEGGRAIFEHPAQRLHVDVFYEKLDFCHAIPLAGRLEVDAPTLPLAELLLGKMQIVQINERDLIDTIMLLLEHPLGDKDAETINLAYVAGLCAEDWGLWRTLTMNLDKAKQLAQTHAQLTAEQKATVATQVDAALQRIEAAPKSFAWRLRARVGDRVKWYKDVEEVK